jgi:large subunit ribosomal protein L21
MKYAVLRSQGHQYRVSEGEEFLVPKVEKDIEYDVLLTVDGETLTVGDPIVKNAKVELKIVEQLVKGEKIKVFKYKAKSRYRKHIGSRPQYSRVRVEKIG